MQPNSKIIFLNEPKLSEHEVDNKFNERRINLIPHVKDFISNHDLFRDKEVSVNFSHKGISSLVCIIDTADKKLVLKIPLRLNYFGEAMFLKAWAQAGVQVPYVIEEGMLDEHSYTLMEYINAPILGDAYNYEELINKGIYLEMGKALRLMHMPKAKGYGLLNKDNQAEYSEFKSWFFSPNLQKRIEYCQNEKFLSEEYGSIDRVYKLLLEHDRKENKSSYCHYDFGTSNIFATDPITIFDPNPEFNNGYLDLARSIVYRIAHDGSFPAQLVEGYFNGEQCNQSVLHAAILLNSYMKFHYWIPTKKIEQIKNVQKYLIENKHLLEKENNF